MLAIVSLVRVLSILASGCTKRMNQHRRAAHSVHWDAAPPRCRVAYTCTSSHTLCRRRWWARFAWWPAEPPRPPLQKG